MSEANATADAPKSKPGSGGGWSIRRRLMLVALGVALPFLILSIGIGWQLAEHERATRRDAIMFSARTLMNAVDVLLAKQIAMAELLATSPALLEGDIEGFRKEAQRARASLSLGWVVVADHTGQQLMNLVRPEGQPLPMRSPRAAEVGRRAIEAGKVQISDIAPGRYLKRQIVTIEVPVFRPNLPPVVLSVVVDPQVILPLFSGQYLPEGWLAALTDRNGNFVARSRDHDRTVGQPASADFRAAVRAAPQGWGHMRSVEGTAVATGYVTSPLSGWVMGVAAETAVFEAPARRMMMVAALAGAAATLLAVILALWAARRIVEPIERIEQGAHALVEREPLAFARTGVPEIDRALETFTSTAEALERHERERDEREAHVHLLMRELSHRSKNLLAIVLAIARQTSRQTSNFEEFEARFNARIQALADAHDLLVEQQWVGAMLEDIVKAQLSAFGMERVTLEGCPVMLKAEAVQNIGLALHELATNASKYGALSGPEGRVRIEWHRIAAGEGAGGLRLTWSESGGPPVAEPPRQGFGRFVLERVTLNALGRGSLTFAPEGLVWVCEIDPQHVVVPAPRPAVPQRRAPDPGRRRAS